VRVSAGCPPPCVAVTVLPLLPTTRPTRTPKSTPTIPATVAAHGFPHHGSRGGSSGGTRSTTRSGATGCLGRRAAPSGSVGGVGGRGGSASLIANERTLRHPQRGCIARLLAGSRSPR
jgi:hypothetical protein